MKAFPYNREIPSDREGYKAYASEDGIDMRDYFAAKAMQAMLKNNSITCQTLNYEEDKEVGDLAAGCIAEGAYQMADAMMEARKND